MAAAVTNTVYTQVLKKKLGDVFRVGAGGGLCFCGINMYFKNDKFYDDWVMPLFGKMEPETASAVAKKAAKYKLVSEEKLQESKLLVSSQPSRKMELEEQLLQEHEDEGDRTYECNDFVSSKENIFESLSVRASNSDSAVPVMLFDSECENDEVCLDLTMEENNMCTLDGGGGGGCSGSRGGSRRDSNTSMRYLSEAGHLGSDLSCCSSPKLERNCMTPDSPSLSMRVNVASPLRTSKMSLATMIEGSNPAYDRMHLDEDADVTEEEDYTSGCDEECLQPCGHKYARTDVVDYVVENPDDMTCPAEEITS
ncbi:hypothetical protein Pcinc_010930 [Petrolisthes cinctipes]|uniref:Uncharacterized protein n=1 Tax=Petrolisthes cinctipes TaxID=88211 RepID=A0AAE1G3Y3_PETCI|nr:hypothetical protein Pcinc_010930 [Petrolisthes cinctipes]